MDRLSARGYVPARIAGTKERTMVKIAATPEMAARIYAKMANNLEVVQQRLGASLTLADKVLLGHLDAPATQALTRSAAAPTPPTRT